MTIKPLARPTARVLLDASNLAVGGGVQVAASLVDELWRLRQDHEITTSHPWLSQLTCHLSPEVNENRTMSGADPAIHVTSKRWSQPSIWLPQHGHEYDLQVTVFGPRYGRRLAPITVTGIADVTSVYSWPAGVPAGGSAARLRRALRGLAVRRLFGRESFLVSESQALLNVFHARTGFDLGKTQVIPNVVNRAVVEPGLRAPLGVTLKSVVDDGTRLLAYVARLYPHKNHAILPKVRTELLKLGMDVKFVVTLTDSEWAAVSAELRESCINVGVIPVTQVADLNLQCDAVIFPSLLESFSATPIEALITNGLLFASDRPFVRDVCGDAAVYFDPLDPSQCARAVFDVLTDGERCAQLRQRTGKLTANSGTARDRATAYVELVSRLLCDARRNREQGRRGLWSSE